MSGMGHVVGHNQTARPASRAAVVVHSEMSWGLLCYDTERACGLSDKIRALRRQGNALFRSAFPIVQRLTI